MTPVIRMIQMTHPHVYGITDAIYIGLSNVSEHLPIIIHSKSTINKNSSGSTSTDYINTSLN